MAKRKLGIPIPTDKTTLLLVGGGLVIGYFGIIQPILRKLGILKTAEEKRNDQLEEDALKKTMADVFAKQQPTYTLAELSSFTETIFEDLRYSALDDDKGQAEEYLKKPRNDADVYHMINFFGKRDECFFGVACYQRTLPEIVRTNLPDSRLANINANYQTKGISFRW